MTDKFLGDTTTFMGEYLWRLKIWSISTGFQKIKNLPKFTKFLQKISPIRKYHMESQSQKKTESNEKKRRMLLKKQPKERETQGGENKDITP